MSVFEAPSYVTTIPLPAPVTATGNTFYTDPNGDIWIANPNVNSGNWARARSVLYCRCYRNAAYNTPAQNTNFVFDSPQGDPYGLFQGASGINFPLAGLWIASATIEITGTAVGDTNAFYLILGGLAGRSSTAICTNATYGLLRTVASGINNVGANTFCTVQTEYMTPSKQVTCTGDRTFMWAKYLGA